MPPRPRRAKSSYGTISSPAGETDRPTERRFARARARGAAKLTADVSDTAKPLFEARKFISQQRNIKQIDEEWLGNTTMSKALGPKPGKS